MERVENTFDQFSVKASTAIHPKSYFQGIFRIYIRGK